MRQAPSTDSTGNDETSPSGTPYDPSETTAALVHPFEVPSTQSCTWSIVALAADPTEDEPRTSMISAPRFATRGMKWSTSHSRAASGPPRRWDSSADTDWPPAVACETSGNCVAEWLPQIVRLRSSPTGVPTVGASCPSARLWSSLVSAVKRSAGTSGACAAAMSALVFAGLPTTTTRTSSAAPALIASPCGPKMPAFAASRSPRSMPAVRGRAPTRRARLAPRKAADGSS